MTGAKKRSALMAGLFMAATADYSQSVYGGHQELAVSDEDKKAIRERNEHEIRMKKGLKKFYYGEDFVWARNQRNADRKARNAGFIS